MNQYIDHTLLKQTATTDDIVRLCEEAYHYQFKAVCVPPSFVKLSKLILSSNKVRNTIPHDQVWFKKIFPHTFENCEVKVCTVIGFPFGYSTTNSKVEEIIDALENGADELDIVQNITSVKSEDWNYVNNEIYECLKSVYKNFHGREIPVVKVILESGILTDEEIIKCCKIYSKYNNISAGLAPISFIKTSTGYAEHGASLHHVQLIKENTPNDIQIKASGGVRNYKFAKQLIDAGVTRIGCSSSIEIMNEYGR